MNILSLFELKGKKAIVTGSAHGIGQAIAVGLAEAGADVAIVDKDSDAAKQTAEEIEKCGRATLIVKTDLTKVDQVEAMVKKVHKKFGRIDILVNDAGINLKMPAEEFDEASYRKVLDINLNGAFYCCREVGKVMIGQNSGNIINVTSLVSNLILRGEPQSAYHVSKAGLAMLTRSLADEWAKYNIRVNALAPGYTKTRLCPDGPANKKTVPISRLASPREMAGTAIYLASEASSFVTGQEIFVDGGWSICGSEAGGIPPAEGYSV